jgi:LAO/AO transport system kinase
MYSINDILSRAFNGDLRAISRLLTIIEFPADYSPEVISEIMKNLMNRGGRAHVIGITGSPGVGKSTLISKLIGAFRKNNNKIAVLSIDPSSPFTLGSFMGNRIRMQSHSLDPNVFIRSTATRGVLGGLSPSAVLLLEAFDGLGFDKILIESVGVGQTDVDIMNVSHTIINVVMPGAGDEIQAMKAGIMEIGDIYVVNKSDKPEADLVYRQLSEIIRSSKYKSKYGWIPKVLKVSSIMGYGIDELTSIIEEHKGFLIKNDTYRDIVAHRRIYSIELILKYVIEEKIRKSLKDSGKDIIDSVINGDIDPYTASLILYNRLNKCEKH